MNGSFVPSLLHDSLTPSTHPERVVEVFLAALARPDTATAATLLDDRVVWTNVGLPSIRGKRAVLKVLRGMGEGGPVSFEVYLHAIAANGSTVLTERTDVIVLGRLRLQFWVSGRFDVRDGRITLWRDSFDFIDVTRAMLRGLAGVALPFLRPRAPVSAKTPPGRH
ncbi:MAG: limonene-1,2-epoxide hydrolase family protein [Jatrophihabitans sp.]